MPRCDECEYTRYDYSEGYDECMFFEGSKYTTVDGYGYCRYSKNTLEKMREETSKYEDEYYKGWAEYIKTIEWEY